MPDASDAVMGLCSSERMADAHKAPAHLLVARPPGDERFYRIEESTISLKKFTAAPSKGGNCKLNPHDSFLDWQRWAFPLSQAPSVHESHTDLSVTCRKGGFANRLEFLLAAPERWAIVVKDTGVGIAAAEHDQIFADLYRVEKTAHLQGIGLGLSIVSRLVELLNGAINVESEPGRGSRFEVVLPCVHGSASKQEG